MSNMMGYIGSSKLPFDINDFNSDSDSQRYEGDTGKFVFNNYTFL